MRLVLFVRILALYLQRLPSLFVSTVIFLFAVAGLYAGNDAPVAPSRDSVLEGYQVIRCHFDEKRIVVKKGSQITVLSEKDILPGTRVVILRIDKEQAVLETRDRARMKEYILVEEKDGIPVLRILKNQPETQPVFLPSSEPVIVTQTNPTENKN